MTMQTKDVRIDFELFDLYGTAGWWSTGLLTWHSVYYRKTECSVVCRVHSMGHLANNIFVKCKK